MPHPPRVGLTWRQLCTLFFTGWEEKMYANLTAAAGKSQGFDCYRPDTVPPQYQYNPSPSKMPQILCMLALRSSLCLLWRLPELL